MAKLQGLKMKDLEPYRDAYELAEIIGLEMMERVIEYFSGMNLYIPIKKKVLSALRDREIIKRYQEGESVNSLARKFGLTSSWVSEIIRKTKS